MASLVRTARTVLLTDGEQRRSFIWVPLLLLNLWLLPGLILLVFPIIISAGETLNLNPQQTRQILADSARQQSAARARANLGYPPVFNESETSQLAVDHRAISEQLRRLPLGSSTPYPAAAPYPLPQPGWQGVDALYDNRGPSIATVSVLLEQRLRAGHYYPLQLGSVEDLGPAIVARLLDQRGEVAQVLTINKQTGLWRTEK